MERDLNVFFILKNFFSLQQSLRIDRIKSDTTVYKIYTICYTVYKIVLHIYYTVYKIVLQKCNFKCLTRKPRVTALGQITN